MDATGKLILNNDGINLLHKNYIDALKKSREYKKTKDETNYIPGIQSLVMRHQLMCHYCNNIKKIKPDKSYVIQLCLNVGVQICQQCIEQHKQHLSFLHHTLLHNQLSLWQFQSMNKDNPFISTISYDKVFKNLIQHDGKEYKISLCAPIFISKKNKDLTFPVYIKNGEEDYFDITHIQQVTLDTFCMFHPSLDKKEIIKRVEKYLTIE